jgi:hypothetical protein
MGARRGEGCNTGICSPPRFSENIVTYLLIERTVEPEKQPLLGNGGVTSNKELLGLAFSVRSLPGLYTKDQLQLRESPETAVRIVGGWCEMVASLRGRDPGSRGTSTVGSRYQAAVKTATENTGLCVIK